MAEEKRLVWTAKELAQLLGTTRKAVYAQASRQRLPAVRLGRRILFPVAAVERWLNEQAAGGEQP
jgi:excisionase family DNA binding protein